MTFFILAEAGQFQVFTIAQHKIKASSYDITNSAVTLATDKLSVGKIYPQA